MGVPYRNAQPKNVEPLRRAVLRSVDPNTAYETPSTCSSVGGSSIFPILTTLLASHWKQSIQQSFPTTEAHRKALEKETIRTLLRVSTALLSIFQPTSSAPQLHTLEACAKELLPYAAAFASTPLPSRRSQSAALALLNAVAASLDSSRQKELLAVVFLHPSIDALPALMTALTDLTADLAQVNQAVERKSPTRTSPMPVETVERGQRSVLYRQPESQQRREKEELLWDCIEKVVSLLTRAVRHCPNFFSPGSEKPSCGRSSGAASWCGPSSAVESSLADVSAARATASLWPLVASLFSHYQSAMESAPAAVWVAGVRSLGQLCNGLLDISRVGHGVEEEEDGESRAIVCLLLFFDHLASVEDGEGKSAATLNGLDDSGRKLWRVALDHYRALSLRCVKLSCSLPFSFAAVLKFLWSREGELWRTRRLCAKPHQTAWAELGGAIWLCLAQYAQKAAPNHHCSSHQHGKSNAEGSRHGEALVRQWCHSWVASGGCRERLSSLLGCVLNPSHTSNSSGFTLARILISCWRMALCSAPRIASEALLRDAWTIRWMAMVVALGPIEGALVQETAFTMSLAYTTAPGATQAWMAAETHDSALLASPCAEAPPSFQSKWREAVANNTVLTNLFDRLQWAVCRAGEALWEETFQTRCSPISFSRPPSIKAWKRLVMACLREWLLRGGSALTQSHDHALASTSLPTASRNASQGGVSSLPSGSTDRKESPRSSSPAPLIPSATPPALLFFSAGPSSTTMTTASSINHIARLRQRFTVVETGFMKLSRDERVVQDTVQLVLSLAQHAQATYAMKEAGARQAHEALRLSRAFSFHLHLASIVWATLRSAPKPSFCFAFVKDSDSLSSRPSRSLSSSAAVVLKPQPILASQSSPSRSRDEGECATTVAKASLTHQWFPPNPWAPRQCVMASAAKNRLWEVSVLKPCDILLFSIDVDVPKNVKVLTVGEEMIEAASQRCTVEERWRVEMSTAVEAIRAQVEYLTLEHRNYPPSADRQRRCLLWDLRQNIYPSMIEILLFMMKHSEALFEMKRLEALSADQAKNSCWELHSGNLLSVFTALIDFEKMRDTQRK